jgi:uncharacterized protein (DUF58 family)
LIEEVCFVNVSSFLKSRLGAAAPKTTAAPVRPVGHDLLVPSAVAAVAELEMVSVRIVEGYLAGQHRSPFKGGCVEFAEHREYSPGDELRMLDWRAMAKGDRYYVKQFEQETNLKATVVVDASGSMAYAGQGKGATSKLRYAQCAAACLARLMLHQRDAVGAAVIDTKVRQVVPPRSSPAHLRPLLDALGRTAPAGDTSLARVLDELGERLARRGLIILLTDAFDDVPALVASLRRLRARGHDLLMLHVMAPEERTFPFNAWSRFECLEVDGRRMDLDPVAVRQRYLERIGTFLKDLELGCGEAGCDYAPLNTDRPLGDALNYYLRRRMARAG